VPVKVLVIGCKDFKRYTRTYCNNNNNNNNIFL